MDPPGRWRQARCRGGNPGARTPSATGGERRQSHLVLGLLRLGERLPALACGAWQGAGESKGPRGKGLKRERTGSDTGREGQYGARDTGGMRGRERAVVAENYRARARARAGTRVRAVAWARVCSRPSPSPGPGPSPRAHPRASLGLGLSCVMASEAAAAPGRTPRLVRVGVRVSVRVRVGVRVRVRVIALVAPRHVTAR